MSLSDITGSRWESASFNAAFLTGSLPGSGVQGYWSASLGSFSSSVSSSAQLSTRYLTIGAPSSSVTLNLGSLVVSWSQSSTEDPGLIDAILFGAAQAQSFGLQVQFSPITFTYAELSSSLNRRGIYANAHSGSPQLSLEPVSGNIYETWPGDIWLLDKNSYIGENGYRFADENKTDNSVYVARPILSRVDETSESVVARYSTTNGPKNINVGISSLVTNGWHITINSGTMSGSGWMNASWSGGIYMPNSGTVAIFGNKNFEVPGGYISASTYLGTIESSSYALTASYAMNGAGPSVSASYALTASYSTTATTLVPLYTFTASVATTPTYQVVSSGSQHLPTGVYVMSLMATNDNHINEVYTGQLSWYAGNTNSTSSDEISMHRAGVSPGSMSLYLQTRHRTGNVPMYLELASNLSHPTASYYFSFVKIL